MSGGLNSYSCATSFRKVTSSCSAWHNRTLVFAWVPSERRCIYDLWHQWHICMNENEKWRYVLNGIKHDRHIYMVQWHNIDELNIIWYMLRSKVNTKIPKTTTNLNLKILHPLSATPRKTSSLLHGDIEPGRWSAENKTLLPGFGWNPHEHDG